MPKALIKFMTAFLPYGSNGSNIIRFFMMGRKKHDWSQGWQRGLVVTVGSLLSVALFALLCWGVNCTDLKYQRRSMGFFVGLAWVVMTVFLLRKQFSAIPKKDNYHFVAYLFFGMSIGSAAAFMITGPATKITNLGALKIVLGVRRFLLY